MLPCSLCLLVFVFGAQASQMEKAENEVDKLIEDEITKKLAEDLLQSIEMKFYSDLSKSLNLVLLKVKMILHNGTTHIQDGFEQLQRKLDNVNRNGNEKDICVVTMQNKSISLAHNTLHQMVLCAYALIGHDPSQAILKVIQIKKNINEILKPMHNRKEHIYDLLKICGHDHESLKKVIKCVISKSPILKTALMEVTQSLIDGVLDLTKQIAHGAMHEACLIEVVKSAEDAALKIVKEATLCQQGKAKSSDKDLDNNLDDHDNHDEKDKTIKSKLDKFVSTPNITVSNVIYSDD